MANLFHNPHAFAPMFDTYVRLTGTRVAGASTRAIDGTFKACVLDNGYADPIGDTATASTVRLVLCYIPRRGPESWRDETPPKRGDMLRPVGGGNFKVTSVDATDESMFTLEARET